MKQYIKDISKVIKDDIYEKEFKFSENIFNEKYVAESYYKEECEPEGKLLENWIDKAKSIIKDYDDVLKKWSSFEKSLKECGLIMDNFACNEVKKIVIETGKILKI